MKVAVITTDGAAIRIGTMPDEDVMELVTEWTTGEEPVLTLALDEDGVTHIARAHIIRIDVDEEP
jgi:hypothetical protein